MIYIFLTVFLGGILSVFSPCIFPVIPLYLGILSEGNTKISKIINTFLFVLGLGVTFLSLGFSFGIIGEYLFFDPKVKIVAGIIVIIFGLSQLDLIKFKKLQKTKVLEIDIDKKGYKSYVKSFLLGLTFSLGWTPCVGPILASVLTTASSSKLAGVLLMLAYTIGLSLPFLVFSFLSASFIQKSRKLNNYLIYFKHASGYLIILLGILLIFDKLSIFA